MMGRPQLLDDGPHDRVVEIGRNGLLGLQGLTEGLDVAVYRGNRPEIDPGEVVREDHVYSVSRRHRCSLALDRVHPSTCVIVPRRVFHDFR